ncbi:hypothetical protein [Alistipes sp. CHKCI003]|jgi:hypothetical protein|uniref:hypothetical protein n=1 Tax=Alistipes sp. CHKCI003 TaxID=1780376 RepID=UPI0007A91994|nr:hypothetical protein [Alistipes sp. CHKCI003]CVI65276.1 hypothetical protein BN3659_00115 [Alistipes sp. CHKCI003]DAL98935.1 MAG TPA: hypothetical protein [Caudoviricetes sp.]
MGLHPDVFESLTPAEFSYAWLGWAKRERDRERQDWERERWSVWVLTSIQLERKDRKPMVEMFPMPWDNVPSNNMMTLEERQKRVKQMMQCVKK